MEDLSYIRAYKSHFMPFPRLLPCEKQPCNAILPRWARELALRHTCWELKDRQAAELWASGGSIEPPDDFVAQALEEIFNYKP